MPNPSLLLVMVVYGPVWIAQLNISYRTAQKITNRHNVSAHEVQDAVVCRSGLVVSWDEDPERGLRAIVETTIRGRKVLVVLYPADDPMDDAYNLGSVYFVDI